MHSECWLAHDAPERPLTYGCWVCDCRACAVALEALARREPSAAVVVKRNMGRNVAPVAEFLARGAEAYCEGPDDYVREVFVADGRGDRFATMRANGWRVTR